MERMLTSIHCLQDFNKITVTIVSRAPPLYRYYTERNVICVSFREDTDERERERENEEIK